MKRRRHRVVVKEELETYQEFVIKLNQDVIEVSGGASGSINVGNLAYGLYRGLTFANKERRFSRSYHKVWAARTLYEIARKHPFTNGNKRTSFVICKMILILGGFDLQIEYEEATKFLIKIARGKVSYEKICKWIEHRAIPMEKKLTKQTKQFIDMLAELSKAA